jgi:hypothetical protein
MAKSKKMAPGAFKKSKTSSVAPVLSDLFIPKTIGDAAMYAVPWAKATRAVGGIVKKGSRFVGKTYKNMGR